MDPIQNFPQLYKRPAYRNHKANKEKTTLAIEALKQSKKGDLTRIANKANMSINTLKTWKKLKSICKETF